MDHGEFGEYEGEIRQGGSCCDRCRGNEDSGLPHHLKPPLFWTTHATDFETSLPGSPPAPGAAYEKPVIRGCTLHSLRMVHQWAIACPGSERPVVLVSATIFNDAALTMPQRARATKIIIGAFSVTGPRFQSP
jgi:hypothetical protein